MATNSSSWYQYPNRTDSSGMFELFGYVNRTADNLFMPVMLLVIWIVIFVGTFSSGGGGRPAAARGFVFASFVTAILSILTSAMGFLGPKWMYLSFILVAVGLLWVKIEND
jgi:hypothetical protein